MVQSARVLDRDSICNVGGYVRSLRRERISAGCVRTRIALLVCLFVSTAACCHGYLISDGGDPSAEMAAIAIAAPTPSLEPSHVSHLHLPPTTGWEPKYLTACDSASHAD